MSQFAGLGSSIGGAIPGPIGAAISIGSGIYGLIAGRSAQKRARRAQQARERAVMDLIQRGSRAGKMEVQQNAAEARGAALQSMASRGLGNSTALDTALTGVQENTARNLARIDADTASALAGATMNFQDVAPDIDGAGAAKGIAEGLSSLAPSLQELLRPKASAPPQGARAILVPDRPERVEPVVSSAAFNAPSAAYQGAGASPGYVVGPRGMMFKAPKKGKAQQQVATMAQLFPRKRGNYVGPGNFVR